MRRSLAVLVLLLLAACAPIWVSTPQTFDERLVAGVATLSAVRTTTATLLSEGQISVEDAKNVQSQAEKARESIEAARALHATDPDAGNVRLTAVVTDLQGLQTYLNSRRPIPCLPIYCWFS